MPQPDILGWNGKILDINNSPRNLKGLLTDITAPALERDFDTDKRSGEMGIVPRPRHITEIEVSFTVAKISKELIRALLEGLGSYNKTVTLQATAIVPNDAGVNEAYIWNVRGYMSSVPLGDLSADGIEAEFALMATYINISFGSDFAFVYDPENYIYSINNVNQWSDLKTLIG